MIQPSIRGTIGELVVAARLLELGYVVSQPVAHAVYDFIIDTEAGLLRIQVKSTTTGFVGLSSRQRGGKRKLYSKTDWDYLIVVESGTFWIISMEELPQPINTITCKRFPTTRNAWGRLPKPTEYSKKKVP